MSYFFLMKAAFLIVEHPTCSLLYCSDTIDITTYLWNSLPLDILVALLSSKFYEVMKRCWTTSNYTANMNGSLICFLTPFTHSLSLSPALPLSLSLSLNMPDDHLFSQAFSLSVAGRRKTLLLSVYLCPSFPYSYFSSLQVRPMKVHLLTSKVFSASYAAFVLFILQLSLALLFHCSYERLVNSRSLLDTPWPMLPCQVGESVSKSSRDWVFLRSSFSQVIGVSNYFLMLRTPCENIWASWFVQCIWPKLVYPKMMLTTGGSRPVDVFASLSATVLHIPNSIKGRHNLMNVSH